MPSSRSQTLSGCVLTESAEPSRGNASWSLRESPYRCLVGRAGFAQVSVATRHNGRVKADRLAVQAPSSW
mgnify:CR=1 FL=1